MTAVLCARLSAMGDLVHCLGALTALHRVRPDWRITLVTQADHAELARGLPGMAQVIAFDRRGGPAALWRLGAVLRAARFDHALDLQGNWKSALIVRLSGARDRIGAAAGWRREPASRVLLHRTVAVAGSDHPALVAHALVRALAPEAPFVPTRLVGTRDERDAVCAAVRRLGVDPGQPFRLVVVTDPRDPRALRPEIVAAQTAASPLPVVHLFGPDAAALPATSAPVLRHGHGTPRQLVALGEVVAAAAGDVLGPDQGATHVLAAAGAPCHVWFGAQDPRRTAPVLATALVHPEPPACSPCRWRRCRHPDGPVCMQFTLAEGCIVPFAPPPDPGA